MAKLHRAAIAANPPTSVDETLLDKREVCALLGIGQRTLDRWHAMRVGPPRINLPGATVRYRRSSVMQWAISREMESVRADGGRVAA